MGYSGSEEVCLSKAVRASNSAYSMSILRISLLRGKDLGQSWSRRGEDRDQKGKGRGKEENVHIRMPILSHQILDGVEWRVFTRFRRS